MVIAHLTNGTIVLGLSRVNIDRLLQGKPIKVTNATHGCALPDDVPCLGIMFGETEADIKAELETNGVRQ